MEKSIVDALDKQYADVLLPLKENLTPKKFGLKYVQKLAKRSVGQYVVPDEVSWPSQILSSLEICICFCTEILFLFFSLEFF